MNRRKFMKTGTIAGLAAAGTASLAAPALSQGMRRWRLTHAYPKNYPIFGTAPNLIADIVKRASAGRIEVEVYGAGEIVPAFEAIEAVGTNTCQMGYGTSYFWKGKEPAAQFITGMPFGLTAQEQNGWFVAGGTELCQKVYDRLNVKFFVAGNSGAQMGGWFNKEIAGPQDFNGLKMRMPGLGGEVLSAIGGTIVNLPGGELLQALQTGAIDALEWIGPSSDLAFGFHKVASHYYYPGWQEPSGIFDCFVNMDEWNKLEPEFQAIIEVAAEAANGYVLNQLAAQNPPALRSLVDEHGVQLRRFSDETLIRLAEASGEVINDIASQDPLSRELLDSLLKFRADALGTTSVAEQAVLNARSLDYQFAQPG